MAVKKKLLLIISLILSIIVGSDDLFSIKKYPIPIAKNLAFFVLMESTSLISHELGHAVLSNIFSGSPIDIHLGSHKKYKNPIFKSKHLTIERLNPSMGYSVLKKNPPEKWQEILIDAGGGIAELIKSYISFSLLTAYHRYQKCKNLKEALKYGLKNAHCPFEAIKQNKNLSREEFYVHTLIVAYLLLITTDMCFNSFLPNGSILGSMFDELTKKNKSSHTDGTKIWKNIGLSKEKIGIVSIASWIAETLLIFLIATKTSKYISEYKNDKLKETSHRFVKNKDNAMLPKQLIKK